jgi:hypothetical protein
LIREALSRQGVKIEDKLMIEVLKRRKQERVILKVDKEIVIKEDNNQEEEKGEFVEGDKENLDKPVVLGYCRAKNDESIEIGIENLNLGLT